MTSVDYKRPLEEEEREKEVVHDDSLIKFSRKVRSKNKYLRKRIRLSEEAEEEKEEALMEHTSLSNSEEKKLIETDDVLNETQKIEPSSHETAAIRHKPISKFDVAVTYHATGSALPLGAKDQGAAIHLAPSELDEIDRSKKSVSGPIRAPANVRLSVRFDYQPDICKDYKETGYCGFGDSCIFLHDRGDYKSGWQLEKEWEAKKKIGEDTSDYTIKEEPEELPFACYICREEFRQPVVTKCKHYFCESCFLQHHKKSSKCALCGYQTMGIVSPAKELMMHLKKKKSMEETHL
jgi:RING finger protein 113A